MTDSELCLLFGLIAFAVISFMEAWKIDRLQERLDFYWRMNRNQMNLIKEYRERVDAQDELLKTTKNEQPAAYDVDNVVEQMEEYGKWKGVLYINKNGGEQYIPVKKAIEIVKAGEKDVRELD